MEEKDNKISNGEIILKLADLEQLFKEFRNKFNSDIEIILQKKINMIIESNYGEDTQNNNNFRGSTNTSYNMGYNSQISSV